MAKGDPAARGGAGEGWGSEPRSPPVLRRTLGRPDVLYVHRLGRGLPSQKDRGGGNRSEHRAPSALRGGDRIVDYEALYEDLSRVLEDLIDKNGTAPIIVEGARDKKALRALGVGGDVISLNQGTTVFAICESVARRHRDAIIMTDWDARGGRLARQLRDGLAANGVRYDDQLRARLTNLCRKDIMDVESLHTYVDRVTELAKSRNHAKPSKRWYGYRARR